MIDRRDDRHDEHRPERDEDRHVLALDHDVARQVAEHRDPRPEHHHGPDGGDDEPDDDQDPAQRLDGLHAQRVGTSSQSAGMSGSARRGGGIS